MKRLKLAGLLIILSVFNSCVLFMEYGSGVLESKEYDFKDFNSVSITHAANLTVTQGDSYYVQVTADDNIMSKIIVQKNGEEVLVTLPAMSMYTNYTLDIKVTMPEIRKLDASGASRVALAKYSAVNDLQVNLSGASSGTINITSPADLSGVISGASKLILNAEVRSLIMNASGASNVKATGKSSTATLTVSGASEFNGGDFQTDKVVANISGASTGTIKAIEATGSVSGASKLYLKENQKDNVIYSY